MATQNQIIEQQAAELQTDLQQFETQYQMTSAEFYQRFRAGELADDIDFIEWSSFYQMFCSVRERLQMLQDLPTPTKKPGFYRICR